MKFLPEYSIIRSSAVLLCLLAAMGCETFTPDLPSARETEADERRITSDENIVVLVRSEEAASRLVINAVRQDYQLIDRTSLKGLGFVLLDFKRPPGVSGQVAISDLQRAEPSATAGIDHFYTLQSVESEIGQKRSTARHGRLYARSMVDWPDNGCRAHSAIGIIDGPVDPTAPALAGADIVVRDFTNGTPGEADHGAAIADLLVGRGRLKNARLYSASVVSDFEMERKGADVSALIRALDWMQISQVRVVNFSLAGPYNKLLDRAIQSATAKGMLIVAAVGNDGPNANPRYPAAFENVIAVTAVDAAQEVYADAVRGEHVDFSAPGVDVFVPNPRGGQYLSGTSLAAPFVAALIASDRDLVTNHRIEGVRAGIERKTVDLGAAGRDPVFGAGLVQFAKSCGASEG